MELTSEANENEELTLYIPGDRGRDALLYRYQVRLVMDSGEILQEDAWHDANRLSQFFGSSQLEKLLPEAAGVSSQ